MARRLLYHGTDEEVREGDRIEYRTFFLRRKKLGTVVCIPLKTAGELNAEKKPPEDWLIRLDEGTYTGWMYYPEELQPTSRLKFVSRGAEYERTTAGELEKQEEAELETSALKGDLLGCALLLAIALAVIISVAMLF